MQQCAQYDEQSAFVSGVIDVIGRLVDGHVAF